MTRAAAWLLLFLLLAPFAARAQDSSDPPLIVESFECRGNVTTSCKFILGQLYLAEGDPVDEEEIQNAKLRLQWLRNFESVSIYLEKGTQRGRARLVIEVVEARSVMQELGAGLLWQFSSVTHVVTGQWTDYNLFGNGKVLDLTTGLMLPLNGQNYRQGLVRVSYIDPHLFDTKRNFLSTNISYLDYDVDKNNGDIIDIEQAAIDFTFGRRLWDFSFVTAGYQYRPISNRFWSIRQDDGLFESREEHGRSSLILGYGWNSEDSQYFPTRGSALQLTVASDYGRENGDAALTYRNTWSTSGGNVWMVGFAAPHSHAVQFEHTLKPSGDIRRARAFARLTVDKFGRDYQGDDIWSAGVHLGVRFDSRSLGIVTFYVFGAAELKP